MFYPPNSFGNKILNRFENSMRSAVGNNTARTKMLKSALVLVCLPSLITPALPAESSWVDLAVHNFGEPINTMWSDRELSFADDGTMVYSSAREDMVITPGDSKDLYIATFNEETGNWNMPVNMGYPVNAPPAIDKDPARLGEDVDPWITADGNTIFFRSDRLATSNPKNASDLFVTHKVDGIWSKPELIGFPVSTDAGNEHCPAILKDGSTLCFASMREGGYGGSDIYCSKPDGAGGWQEPVNQGPNINTPAEEFHFSQDSDGRVYFTSARPGGYGSLDIWSAVPAGNNSWGEAKNLVPKVNSTGADMCPALLPDKKTIAWLSSRTINNFGSFDIFWTNKLTVRVAE